mmetsp:Transcript_60109/g.173352  ORF Transcript_60109/g.173352 Transcript_60109/m.173352 type:complete len:275 (-) Transcript_60109:150-974(-)
MSGSEVVAVFKKVFGDDAATVDAAELVLRTLQKLDPSGGWGREQVQLIVEKYRSTGSGAPVRAEDLLAWICDQTQGPHGSVAEGRPEVVFVLGGPGSGKGTFSARCVEQWGYQHLSAGDCIRAERQRPGSEMAALIEARLKEGKLIPSDVTVGLLKEEMRRQGWAGGKYLIDGFPRSADNFKTWESLVGNTVDLKFVLLIECSEEVMMKRLLKRGETSGRSDDNEETIRKRFETHMKEAVPVQELLEQKGLVRKVNSDPGIDLVWHEVEAIFGA